MWNARHNEANSVCGATRDFAGASPSDTKTEFGTVSPLRPPFSKHVSMCLTPININGT